MKQRINIQTTNQITNREEGVEEYIKTIKKFGQLDRKEEMELAMRIQEGDAAAFDIFVEKNLLLVVAVARKYQHLGLNLSDLIQFGNEGLIKAVRKYTKYEENKFSSFGMFYIRKEIVDAVEKLGHTIRRPHMHNNNGLKIDKFVEKFLIVNGHYPDKFDIAEGLDMDEKDVDAYLKSCSSMVSLSNTLGDDSDSDTLEDLIGGDINADDGVKTEDMCVMVDGLLTKLNEREKKVVKMKFGIGLKFEYTDNMIADELGISTQQVSNIMNKALLKMQAGIEK